MSKSGIYKLRQNLRVLQVPSPQPIPTVIVHLDQSENFQDKFNTLEPEFQLVDETFETVLL